MANEELGPLPAGRHGYSREQVAHHQRERLIAGLAAAVADKGYAAVTLADITREARVSRRVFYENFESKEQCFLAAFDVVVAHLGQLVDGAVEGAADWPGKAIAATRAVLGFLASEPDLARLLLVESRSAGPAVAGRFNEAIAELRPLLAAGRAARPSEKERPLPDSTEDSVLGSLVSLLHRKVAAGEAARLGELLPDAVEFVLSPYVGPDEASRLVTEALSSSP
jgi:AcrR family transcriptional regulator